MLLALVSSLACAGPVPSATEASEPAPPPAPTDTATPQEAPVDSPETALLRAHAAASLAVAPETLTISRFSSRSAVKAWRAVVDGQTRGPSAKTLGMVLDGEQVLSGSRGFAQWIAAHGREDAVATAIAHHTLIHNATAEPFGSWTRGQSYADPAYAAPDQLVYTFPEARRGSRMQATVRFAADGQASETIAPVRPAPPQRR